MASKSDEDGSSDTRVPVLVPCLSALASCVALTSMQMVGKKLKREGFDVINATFSCLLVIYTCVSVISIAYWLAVEFSFTFFLVGIAGGLVEACGKVLGQQANAIGYSGPASALKSLHGIELTIFIAISTGKPLSMLEAASALLSLSGSILIANPLSFRVAKLQPKKEECLNTLL